MPLIQIKAKYPGKCFVCGEEIGEGELVDWSKETGAKHTYCEVK